jgi:hypothetical protein
LKDLGSRKETCIIYNNTWMEDTERGNLDYIRLNQNRRKWLIVGRTVLLMVLSSSKRSEHGCLRTWDYCTHTIWRYAGKNNSFANKGIRHSVLKDVEHNYFPLWTSRCSTI